MTEWFWVPWVITVVTFVTGFITTRYYKKQDRLYKALDEISKLIVKCEDDALAYWVKADDKVFDYQLTLNLKRLSNSAKRLAVLDAEFKKYSSLYIPFKQAITLHTASTQRPIPQNSAVAKSIMVSSADLQDFYYPK